VISVSVRYTDGEGTLETATSTATAAVASGLSVTGGTENDTLYGTRGDDLLEGAGQ
jgi:hypothetical protein